MGEAADDELNGSYLASDGMDADTLSPMETAKALLRRKLSGGAQGGCTSYLQRQMQCGYNFAANLLDDLVKEKFITESDAEGNRRLIKR